jgi:hypothetical protein
MRECYRPTKLSLITVAKSPPQSGLYFYDKTGRPGEPLFRAIMGQPTPATKEEGLATLKARGWLLVDATYSPVNGIMGKKRDQNILEDYSKLRLDLDSLIEDKSVPVLLIKANVCRLLEPLLKRDGYNVINHGQKVCFPSNGWQRVFRQQFGDILRSAGIPNYI